MIGGFSVQYWQKWLAGHPREDSFELGNEREIIAVADGVTRDPSEWLPDLNTLRGKLTFAWNYERPSPAAEAAEICTRSAVSFLERAAIDEQAMRYALELGNVHIGESNFRRGITQNSTDYTSRDFAGCVGAVAAFGNERVYWSFICDSGVGLFDADGNLKARTCREDPHRFEKFYWERPEMRGKSWADPSARGYIRKFHRNNLMEAASYGVLTGEEAALNYVRAGSWPVAEGDIVLAFTDGAEGTLFERSGGTFETTVVREDCADLLRRRNWRGLKRLLRKNVASEGTVAYMTYDASN